MFPRFLGLALGTQGHRQMVMCRREILIEAEDLPGSLQAGLGATSLEVSQSQVIEGLKMIGVDTYGLFAVGDGLHRDRPC